MFRLLCPLCETSWISLSLEKHNRINWKPIPFLLKQCLINLTLASDWFIWKQQNIGMLVHVRRFARVNASKMCLHRKYNVWSIYSKVSPPCQWLGEYLPTMGKTITHFMSFQSHVCNNSKAEYENLETLEVFLHLQQ